MSDNDSEDIYDKGCALIQAVLGIDPEGLKMDDWAKYYGRAIWVERFRMHQQAELLKGMFSVD